jgi:hypothetical protein
MDRGGVKFLRIKRNETTTHKDPKTEARERDVAE